MRLFWLHLADLFLGITTVAQFGFLGLVIMNDTPVSVSLRGAIEASKTRCA